MPTDEDFAELTQLLDTDELEEGPRLIATHYAPAEDALEMVRAAQLLGLGVRLYNRRIEGVDEEGEESATEEWVLDLLESPPSEIEED